MGTEEGKDMLRNMEWKSLGSSSANEGNGAIPKQRVSQSRFRQIPEFYFLPRRSWTSVIGVYGSLIAAGIGAGMLVEVWINKKIQEDGGVVWDFEKK